MKRRYLQNNIEESLRHFPAVLITGARQVGKSTLSKALIKKTWAASYITFDDRAVLDAALRDPDGFIKSMPTPAIIDEVQRAPDVLLSIKRTIDHSRKTGQYLLTGSANILTLSKISETLAGRVAVHNLYPFSWTEILDLPLPTILKDLFECREVKDLIKKLFMPLKPDYQKKIEKRILIGGYPPAVLIDSDNTRREWFSSYCQTYLERDLLNIQSIENLPDFNRLLALAAFRTGRLLNLSDFSRETGLPFTTLRRYMNLLEVTYQVFRLHPYFANIGKRLVKMPKLYFSDTGMACHLTGADSISSLNAQGNIGALAETWVAAELLKLLTVSGHNLRLYFWRTQAGQEVDFLIEKGREMVAVEVKWGQRIDNRDIANLKQCGQSLKSRLRLSVILYGGTEIVPLGHNVIAVPFPVFFGVRG
jgi:predicted AAA+ superfamily ATPase